MKKKLVSILLCMAMLVTGAAFTGCANRTGGNSLGTDTTGEGQGSKERPIITLTLWVPTQEGTTEDALFAVEEAINQITQSQYQTAVKLYAVPDAEYEKTVKDRMKLIEQRIEDEEQAAIDRRKQEIEAAKNGETLVEGTTAYINPNMDGDLSLVVRGATGYSPVERNQMDIFLIRGSEDYQYYIDNFYVQSLNEEISGSSKVLSSYIFPSFFDAATVDGTIYGVPNNHEIGEYTYFLVNKRIADAEYLDPNKLTNLSECQDFIEDVAKYYPGVTPVYGDYSPSYYKFFSSKGQDSFSVLAARVTPETNYDNLKIDNIFGFNNYTSNFYLYKKFVESGYVSTNEVNEFGVGYITCTRDEIAKYADDYYINVFKRPEGTKEDYLESVFAVSSHTKSVSRSMEIITMLNTDPELRTILQYGAQGTHWKYDEEDSNIIVKLSDDYKMNLLDTGNIYMTYPDYGVSRDYWTDIQKQNLDSFFPITYSFDDYKNEDNAALLAQLDQLNTQIWSEMQSMSAEDFRNSVGNLQARVNNNDAFQKLTYIPKDNDASKGRTPENGWKDSASISSMLQEFINTATGNTEEGSN